MILMKRILILMAFAALAFGPTSCSKSDDNPAPALASAPEADPAEDTKSGGVYKGALIGSSGIIKITLQKGVKEVEITLDKVKKKLTTTSLNSWTSGQAIVDAVFTGDGWSVTFSMDETGTNGNISFDIPGHASMIGIILKEHSTSQVKAYEGEYKGSDSGTWNFIEKSGLIYGVSRSSNTANGSSEFYGQRSGNNLTITLGVGATATGTINGNSCSGDWVVSADNKGTWSGTRTL